MKLQIDTDRRIIKVEDKVNLGELIDTLNRFFPDEEWKNFDIDANSKIEWTYPVIREVRPYYPWWYRTDNEYTVKYNSGVFNIDTPSTGDSPKYY